jgi:hypothetical protein
MKLPIQSPPVYRMATSPIMMQVLASGVMPSAKYDLTGKCVCRKNGSVKFTASSTICTNNNHDGCTGAKVACTAEHLAECNRMGGTLSQSGEPCQVGRKC